MEVAGRSGMDESYGRVLLRCSPAHRRRLFLSFRAFCVLVGLRGRELFYI